MATKDLKSIKFPGLPDTYEVPAGGGGTVTKADIEKALGYKPIGADDVPVKSVNGQTGETKTNWYFNVTGSVASPRSWLRRKPVLHQFAQLRSLIFKGCLRHFRHSWFPA